MDESHEAGGSKGADWKKSKDAAPNRAEFARELVDLAGGVAYASATYAKGSYVMGLYSATSIKHAVEDPDQIGELIDQGGDPAAAGDCGYAGGGWAVFAPGTRLWRCGDEAGGGGG